MDKVVVNGEEYFSNNPLRIKKMRLISNMIEDHKNGADIAHITHNYGYKDQYYIKRLFREFGYLGAHTKIYEENPLLGKKNDETLSKVDLMWNNLLCRKL